MATKFQIQAQEYCNLIAIALVSGHPMHLANWLLNRIGCRKTEFFAGLRSVSARHRQVNHRFALPRLEGISAILRKRTHFAPNWKIELYFDMTFSPQFQTCSKKRFDRNLPGIRLSRVVKNYLWFWKLHLVC